MRLSYRNIITISVRKLIKNKYRMCKGFNNIQRRYLLEEETERLSDSTVCSEKSNLEGKIRERKIQEPTLG